jgi:RecA-family ATPase
MSLLSDEISAELNSEKMPDFDAELNSGKILGDTFTVDELLNADLPEQKWLVNELIPVGLVSLAGRPKVGKSWMALQLAVAVATGGRFLDKQVEQGAVLYIALEDGKGRLKNRLEAINVEKNSGMPLTFKSKYRLLNAGGLDDLYLEAESGFYKLIVIDTFGRAVGQIEVRDYSENVSILAPLQSLAQRTDTTILLVDHHSKLSRSNPIYDLIGSIGKAGTYDTIAGLYREQGKQGAKFAVIGRDQDDIELSVEFDHTTYCWQSLGDISTAFDREVLDAIMELTRIGEMATPKSIADHLGAYKGQVGRSLANLLNNNKVKKLPKQGVLQPYDVV